MNFLVVEAVKCGAADHQITIPGEIAGLIGTIVNVIKIGVPIILIVLGMLDMGKAVASQKEDEIKKGQKILLSRVVAAAIVFFVVAIVQLLLSIISTSVGDTTTATGENSIWYCVCRLSGGKKDACAAS